MSGAAALDAAVEVVRRLRGAGHEAWIAGGAVRDRLLGCVPHDVDVATSAKPDDVSSLFPGSQLVGAAFGVALVRVGAETVEVATFRTDGPYEDGRRPSHVTFGTIEDDAQRRDFTVNGLYLDPDSGRVLDLVGGRNDLESGIVRAIGEPADRFREDHLRLLRAIRFAAQLGFEIEPATWEALIRLAPKAAQVASERTRDELIKVLTGPAPVRGLELLRDSGLLAVILPEVAAMDGVAQPPKFHPEGDVLTHTILLFAHLEQPTPELAFAALLHDVGKPPTYEDDQERIRFPRHAKVGADLADGICQRLRLSNDSREHVVELVANHMRFLDVTRMRPATLKRFLRLPRFDDHLALHRADCLASHRRLDHWEFVRSKVTEFGEADLRPARLVSGHDLLANGWPAGPLLGRELRRLEGLQLDGRLATREEALEVARRDLAERHDNPERNSSEEPAES